MTCKDCLHCEVCFIREMLYMNASKTHWMNCDDCLHFKDKTQWASQRWIPVTERLPEPLEDILVYDATRKNVAYGCMTVFAEWCGVPMKSKVTHWMPLPDAPKDGE